MSALEPIQSGPTIDHVERNWVGTYLTTGSRPVSDIRDPSGRRWLTSAPTPLEETAQIPARLGVRFGLGFTIHGTPSGAPVDCRRVWHFPPTTNPETGMTMTRSAAELGCLTGQTCYTGQFLAESFEVVPGRWSVEVICGGTQVLEQQFTLYPVDR